MNVVITVPPGELVDKITILEIKQKKVKDKPKLSIVKKDLGLLKITLSVLLKASRGKALQFKRLKLRLYAINLRLWNIENVIRELEDKKEFGRKFITAARSVYITNDKRSKVKNEINTLFGSSLSEVKQYSKYKTK